MKNKVNLIVMGGSWGGFQASLSILRELPADFRIPIILVLHRQKNTESDLHLIYDRKLLLEAKEVEEKELIRGGCVYLAPANYHVLIEKEGSFSLDDSELVNFSRPAIDVTFNNAAEVYGSQTLGILLSGASEDGSRGLRQISDKGGIAIVQTPEEAEAETMPRAAIKMTPGCLVLSVDEIREYLIAIK